MFFYLFPFLKTYINALQVIRYPSFRMAMAMITAGAISFLLYPKFISYLKNKKFGQKIRSDGPESHFSKKDTPTMGGVIIIISSIISTLLWADLSQKMIWILIFAVTSFGLIGVIDDIKKYLKNNSLGLSARQKFLAQILCALIVLLFYSFIAPAGEYSFNLLLPFVSVTKFILNIPAVVYIAFGVFMIVAYSNAANLCDGLDGLATVPAIFSLFVYLVLAYLAGTIFNETNVAEYLKIIHVKNAFEITIFCAAFIGSLTSFLWFNSFPAQIFMGDTGSLSIGAVLGVLAILTKNELLSVVFNGVFVMQALSVVLQILSFKIYKKRIFKMAPLHHHFELLGWPEPKVIVRFWIISGFLSLISLLSIKIR